MIEAARPELEAAAATLLVLGVTPELIALEWPREARMIVLDSSAGVISALWGENPRPESEVICALWQDMPLGDASMAAAVGDGSLNALTSLAEYQVVLAQLARVLRPRAILALRCFVRPERSERPDELAARAMRGDFPTISTFRFRLAMTLAGPDARVSLGDLPPVMDALFPDRDALAHATGWTRAEIDSTDAITGAIPVTFPTEAELTSLTEPGFERIAVRTADYPEAVRCPTLVWRRRH